MSRPRTYDYALIAQIIADDPEILESWWQFRARYEARSDHSITKGTLQSIVRRNPHLRVSALTPH